MDPTPPSPSRTDRAGNRYIEDVAALDPVMALALALRIKKVPYAWTLQGIFPTTLDFNTVVEAKQQEPLAQRTWIRSAAFTLWLPMFGPPNNILTTLSNMMLRFNTGVLAQLWGYDAPKYIIAPFTPLETLVPNLTAEWVHGWRMERQEALKMDLQLQQGPGGTTTDVGPYRVQTTFLGWQFFHPYIDEIPPEEARCVLEKAGFDVGPSVRECAQEVSRTVGLGRIGGGRREVPDFASLDSDKPLRPSDLGGWRSGKK